MSRIYRLYALLHLNKIQTVTSSDDAENSTIQVYIQFTGAILFHESRVELEAFNIGGFSFISHAVDLVAGSRIELKELTEPLDNTARRKR